MNNEIVACARGWIGTRFHHQGRIKKTQSHKGGVDCLGLLTGVAAELKLAGDDGIMLASEDENNYPHNPDVKYLRKKLSELLAPIATDDIVPGNIVLLNVDNSPQHLAIVSDMNNGLGIIHSYAPAKAVVEHNLDAMWRGRIEAAYRVES